MSNRQDQIRDSKEIRRKFEQILDRYNIKSNDKKELKTLSRYMWTLDDDY